MFTNRSSVSIKFICSLETCAPLKDITEGLKEIYSTLRLLHFHRLFIYMWLLTYFSNRTNTHRIWHFGRYGFFFPSAPNLSPYWLEGVQMNSFFFSMIIMTERQRKYHLASLPICLDSTKSPSERTTEDCNLSKWIMCRSSLFRTKLRAKV